MYAQKKVTWKRVIGKRTQALLQDQSAGLDRRSALSISKRNLYSNETPQEARERRRRMYRPVSEEKPAFPAQNKNFHAHVMENKEVVKALGLLATCTQNVKQV